MKIISLDQNVISFLVRMEHDPLWKELKETLIAGVESGKLLCPIPKETIAETIPCRRETRIKIRDLQVRLSAGFSFKSFVTIEGEETLALVRSGLAPVPYERINWHSVENDSLADAKAKELQDKKKAMRDRMETFVEPDGQNQLSIQAVMREILTERSADFYRQIQRLINAEPLDPCDSLSIRLCGSLTKLGITQAEMLRLLDKIQCRKWEAIPLVFFHAALGAILDFDRLRGRKYEPNDEIDLFRAATALHCYATLIVENPMAGVIKRLEKEVGVSLDVFAVSDRDAINAELALAIAA